MTAKNEPAPPLQGVIFDLDGTLADTLPVCFAAFRAAFGRYAPERGITSDEQIAAYFGPSEEGMIQQIVAAEYRELALEMYLAAYEESHSACSAPFPGLTAILDLLRAAGVRTAVVTGKGARSAAISLARLGLAPYFPLVETGSAEGAIKPQAIRHILEQWGLPASAVAYVGDAPYDMTAAREAGVLPLAAAWASTADPEALAEKQPLVLFRSVTDFDLWLRSRIRLEEGTPQWLRWARRIAALAQNGLAYVKDPYDAERYMQLRELATEILASHTGEEAARIADLFAGEVGYATPKLDVRGVVFRDTPEGEPALLLVKERSDGGWTLPGGWVDVGEAPSEAVEKEVREESGYEVRTIRVLGLLDRDRHGHPPLVAHVWKVFLLCELVGGEAASDGVETEGVSFFREQEIQTLPLSLSRVVPSQIARLFEHWRHTNLPTDFD